MTATAPRGGRSATGQWRRRVSIGEVLAAARRQAGLTITQVSQRTCIRETIIRGIEEDDFAACGGDFYARGHIRAIARAAGVDGEPLVRQYDSSHRTPKASTAAGVPGPCLRLRQRHGRAVAATAVAHTQPRTGPGHAGPPRGLDHSGAGTFTLPGI